MQFFSRIFFLFFLLISLGTKAQHPGKKEAKELFEKTFVYLKVGDERGFIDLWSTATSSLSHQVPVTVSELREHFAEMRVFLDTALKSNMQIDEVLTEKLKKEEADELGAKGRITAIFNYGDSYRKGISFYVDKVGEKWMIRSAPDYLTETSKK
jgi:hypothetical protein